VSAFAGREQLLRCYSEAMERNYRFASYGDAMLII
jgi:S-adenosylmethionine:tRNA ribosyltransferase-isomerase